MGKPTIEFERQIAKVKLVERYARNEETIAPIRTQFHKIGLRLCDLSKALLDDPLTVRPADDRLAVRI